MAKMLKLITCENCKKLIDETKKYRCFEYNGMLVCEDCYEELSNDGNTIRTSIEKHEQ